MRLQPAQAWRARLRAAADCAPARARVPLWWRTHCIGTVEPDLFDRAGVAGSRVVVGQDGGWGIAGELTPSLAAIALVLRDRGLAHTWRDEQLAVRGAGGVVLGTVERAAARALGITTHAVHLAAVDGAGRHWLQQRAFDKPTDPGRLDTLVGGMVPASDDMGQALERETWEEAGLRLKQVQDLRYGGRLVTRRPMAELPHGYVVEVLDWCVGTLPDGVVPHNQDGEVAGFRAVPPGEVTALLERDAVTIDAALVLLAAFAD